MTNPASPAQEALITRLLGEKDLTGTPYAGHTVAPAGLTKEDASRSIDALFALPRLDLPSAEPGYYLRGGEAVKVQANKAGTGTYAKVWTGTKWEYAPGVGKTLAGLTPMTAEAAARIGLASGHCIACAKPLGGKTLTAKVAALVGYGETCAANEGWPFPKGAAAQRARLAEGMGEADAQAEAEHLSIPDEPEQGAFTRPEEVEVPDSPASLFTGHWAGETTTSRFD
jgi:hypothetical protein